jgi:tRNA-dihydrouridine synthase 4
MSRPEHISEIVRHASAYSLPVSVKIRVAIESGEPDIPKTVDLARQAVSAGAQFLTIHGRTKNQGPSTPAVTAPAKELRGLLSVPVIYNGDVFSPRDLTRVWAETGCHGVMVARGLLKNPGLLGGAEETPREFAGEFLRDALSYGCVFPTLHHHLMMALGLPRSERLAFNSLQSSPAVIDFLRDRGMI